MKPLPGNYVFWLVMVAGWLLLGGCSSAPTIDGSAAAAAPVDRYIIGPGDSLEIFVRDNPSLSTTVPVRPDGRISIPLVQSIVAAGETPEKLAGDLESALSRYVRSPLVTVIVKSFVGAYSQQVRVVGQATMPKAVPYRSGMTLLDVMIEVGGLTKFAAGNGAKVARRLPDGNEQTIPVRLDDLMNGAIKYNMAMYPGDILIIPQSLL
ncbi:XrtA/PEP-CTERM system exopolysaccharide export protein [Rhodanobacter sp. KK11]|uniref:XrtA/PEP-CTERM system exopolysaccharide export protein n=1 Tax=Rhodanobacter sp. KK11 TaxID=3083255 RepID=UPI00296709F7|nr:XrtA/PEP-CTERM system exopolysaccharide export protein [Rhodanobacter sp. KK11]MDW2983289.1 polysaccharide export protein [Rhodanobacter sp. KK11]